ncbi:MAG: TonB-dependent receptor [Acidobacteriota bacterium]
MRRPFRSLLVAVVVLAAATSAFAQTFTGGLRGAVRDAGGVVPGVTVQLVNEATNQTREGVSNEAGEYNFAAVPPGTYTIRASLTGFKTYERKGVRIAAQQFITLDIVLEVGQLQETITVTGEAPLIDTSNASGGAVINSQQLATLPSGGRSAFLFAVTLPTVVASGDPQFNRQQDQTNASLLSLGGGTRRGNNYLLDGVPITDLRNRASANPTIEALEDVAVQVHNYDAETGRTGGGTFNTAAKSGTNEWHGSGFWQTRPRWGSANNFFAERAGTPKPDTYYHLGGGGFGGPIVRNRTFFWFASEGYGSNTTRNGALRFPTARERNGDFSQSFDSAGNLVIIYDPLTGDPVTGAGRTPFPGNVIPANRLNTVARNITSFMPNPDIDRSNGQENFFRTAEIIDRAQMYTGKVDHRFSDSVSLSGFYLYNKTDEPCSNFWEPGRNGPNRFADPNDYILARRVHILALNNTWLPSSNTVLTLRYGWTQFRDDDTLSIDFDPARLGFNSSFINAMQVKKFPNGNITDYASFGAIDPTDRNWYSWSANGTLSRLVGRHTLKFGADFRTIGLDAQSFAGGAGTFNFDRRYTSSNPNTNGTGGSSPSGNAFASFLLGFPTGDPGNLSNVFVSEPFNVFTRYYGVYAQDDFRVKSNLTLNFGLRLEHEDGLREEENRFTVGFDQAANPGGALGAVRNPLTGQPIRGGLIYAGQNGANEYQGDPPALKVSPRIGLVYSINPKTVVRGGYGVYWAPWNYQFPSATNFGQTGYSLNTFIDQGQFFPTTSLTNPFPNGVLRPVGNALGALTGVGGTIDVIDQNKKAPYVQMYSFDINRELPGNMAVGFEYAGATGRDLGLGGSNDGIVNINQLDPRHLALGAALNEQVPNPFFGLPAGFRTSSATIPRYQLLLPYPQFNQVLVRQSTLGKNQYHAAIFKFEKRVSNGWGGRINYTFSRLRDNQYGETNSYSATNGNTANVYNLDGEYSIGLLDVPHKLVISPIIELPFGEGKRWAQSGIGAAILGDWTISSIVAFESGFPISVSNSSNTLSAYGFRVQRPNLTGSAIETEGGREDRFFGGGATPGLWLNASAFTHPGQFALGTAPRTLEDARTPHRNNWDFVAAKDVRFGGSQRLQIRVEIINITNTVKTNTPNTSFGSAAFGRITSQRGFMRMTQLMFRYSF